MSTYTEVNLMCPCGASYSYGAMWPDGTPLALVDGYRASVAAWSAQHANCKPAPDRSGCQHCEHLRFEPEEPGFSEFTPGGDMKLYCARRWWNASDLIMGDNSLREALSRAPTCPDFVPYQP